jgi:hypothetical protein
MPALGAPASSAAWRRLADELDEIAGSAGASFDADTIANAREFLALLRDVSALPEIVKGYGNSFRFLWGLTNEVEIFGDHVEFYRFHDKRTDIQHHDRKPGEPFPADLIWALSG